MGIMNQEIGFVIIGNGAAGNSAAETIRTIDRNINITLVTDAPFTEYSPCVLPDHVAGEIEEDHVILKDPARYKEQNIYLIRGTAVEGIDPAGKKVFLSHRTLDYEKCIIAVGSLALIPEIPGIEKVRPLPFKSLEDARQMNQIPVTHHFLVLGGGCDRG